ncbi:MAG: hypothetical protein QM820_31220 [Minicystis sp.]
MVVEVLEERRVERAEGLVDASRAGAGEEEIGGAQLGEPGRGSDARGGALAEVSGERLGIEGHAGPGRATLIDERGEGSFEGLIGAGGRGVRVAAPRLAEFRGEGGRRPHHGAHGNTVVDCREHERLGARRRLRISQRDLRRLDATSRR